MFSSVLSSFASASSRSAASKRAGAKTETLPASRFAYYLLAFVVLGVVGLVGNRVKDSLRPENNDQKLIHKYLLNTPSSSSADADGFSSWMLQKKPKMWIHTKYERNARKWESFGSRSSTQLNQAFLELAVETIVRHCGQDFQICLIDDAAFTTILPDWDFAASATVRGVQPLLRETASGDDGDTGGGIALYPEPYVSFLRDEALLQILHLYGGMLVPNSFVALRSLRGIYETAVLAKKPCMLELPSSEDLSPSMHFMAAEKKDPVVAEMILQQQRVHAHHFTGEPKSVRVIDGQHIGVKTADGLPVALETLFEDAPLRLIGEEQEEQEQEEEEEVGNEYHHDNKLYGLYLPADQILARTKYQWFAALSKQEIFQCRAVAAQTIVKSLLHHQSRRAARPVAPSPSPTAI